MHIFLSNLRLLLVTILSDHLYAYISIKSPPCRGDGAFAMLWNMNDATDAVVARITDTDWWPGPEGGQSGTVTSQTAGTSVEIWV